MATNVGCDVRDKTACTAPPSLPADVFTKAQWEIRVLNADSLAATTDRPPPVYLARLAANVERRTDSVTFPTFDVALARTAPPKLELQSVKEEFVRNLGHSKVAESDNPWQSSRLSQSYHSRQPSQSLMSVPSVLRGARSSKTAPSPQAKPPPIQPPSSVDSGYVHERDRSESLRDEEVEGIDIAVQYDQILTRPRCV